MASGGNQYQNLSDIWFANSDIEDPQSDTLTFRPHQPWAQNQRSSITPSFHRSLDRNVFDNTDEGMPPDRFLSSTFLNQADENFHKSRTNMPTKLPSWTWNLLSFALGVDPGIPLSRNRLCVATTLHVLTFATAFCYGGCGLLFNIYDVKSKFTETSALACIAKSVLGIFWIFLGTSSHQLAAQLCSSRGLLNYIRLHSKTFMKKTRMNVKVFEEEQISTVFWIFCLGMTEMGLNFYSNAYLLQSSSNHTENKRLDANCPTIGLPVFLCQLYFVSKIIFSLFNLVWNLIVAAVCLSVCRTHTICIRRFLKELAYDSRIYEEFQSLQNLPNEPRQELTSDDISEYDLASVEDDEPESPSKGENVWHTLRGIRQRKISRSASIVSGPRVSNVHEEMDHIQNLEPVKNVQTEVRNVEMKECKGYMATDTTDDVFDSKSDDMDISTMKTLLMGNEDFVFTYFKLMKHLRSTSHLLERWISSWMFFVMIWCAMLILYWVSHTAEMAGIIQFLIPVFILGFLTSGYAEVNFEGSRVIKFLMPTEERMSVIYYVINTPLVLKAYSYVVTYNALITVVAAVALGFATRIILHNML